MARKEFVWLSKTKTHVEFSVFKLVLRSIKPRPTFPDISVYRSGALKRSVFTSNLIAAPAVILGATNTAFAEAARFKPAITCPQPCALPTPPPHQYKYSTSVSATGGSAMLHYDDSSGGAHSGLYSDGRSAYSATGGVSASSNVPTATLSQTISFPAATSQPIVLNHQIPRSFQGTTVTFVTGGMTITVNTVTQSGTCSFTCNGISYLIQLYANSSAGASFTYVVTDSIGHKYTAQINLQNPLGYHSNSLVAYDPMEIMRDTGLQNTVALRISCHAWGGIVAGLTGAGGVILFVAALSLAGGLFAAPVAVGLGIIGAGTVALGGIVGAAAFFAGDCP